MEGVFQGVFDLPLRKRAPPPVGAGLVLRGGQAEDLLDQRAEARRVLEAHQPGRHLHVEEPLGQAIDRLEAELHLTAAGMNHGLVAAGDDGLPKGPHVADGHRVDHRQPSRGRHLDQAEHGPIGMLGDELGVEGDGLRGGQFLAVVAQLGVGGDVLVVHDWAGTPIISAGASCASPP